jgi:hypothetical protein
MHKDMYLQLYCERIIVVIEYESAAGREFPDGHRQPPGELVRMMASGGG